MSKKENAHTLLDLMDLPSSEREMLDGILELSKDLKGLDEIDKKYAFMISEQISIEYSRENYQFLFELLFTLGRLKGKSDSETKATEGTSYKKDINLMMPALGKKILKQLAQAVAKSLWEINEYKSLRTGKMTDLVYLKLDSSRSSFIHNLNSGNDTNKYHARCLELAKIPSLLKVREWVSDIAPQTARKPGRSKII
jgi:hypothetical protein